MDADKITLLMKQNFELIGSKYADSVVAILTPPKWYYPIKRYKYSKNFKKLIYVVMAEYAQELISELN